jgi:hypothetical protein
MKISDEAVEAALKVVSEVTDAGFVRQILGAAAPRMLAGQQAALDAVRELHTEDVFRGHLSNGCRICGGGVGWPCPTIEALDTCDQPV